ncbi:MAG: hypothetical protein K2I95_10255 [Treponemataceae bacterium]|nr:hypothetical protein [Treponemataceae bacterium]
MFKRVTKKQCAIARQRAHALLHDVQKTLNEKYKFAVRLVGSGAWGTMIEDEKGEYDLDYQMLLSKNSLLYKKNGDFPNPTEVKNDFISAFEKCRKGKEKEKIENSTTAITLTNEDGKPYHIDFVIIKTLPENNFIIRRNNKKESPQRNEFTWDELPQWNEVYSYFKSLSPNEKRHLIEKIIIPKKQKEKSKPENDASKISSSELFIREVNNYRCQQEKK